eukprot:scaffold5837_cov111-Isochrysis_galbana.AAC.1
MAVLAMGEGAMAAAVMVGLSYGSAQCSFLGDAGFRHSGTGLAAVEEEAPSPPDEESPPAAEHAQVGAAGIGVAAGGARADEHVVDGPCMDCSQSEGEGEGGEEGGRPVRCSRQFFLVLFS